MNNKEEGSFKKLAVMKFQAMMMYTAMLLVIIFLSVSHANPIEMAIRKGDAEPLSDALQRIQEELEQQGW